MEIKFTPWRMAYVAHADAPADAACILCARGHDQPQPTTLVLYRGAHSYVLMNLYPYNTGHLMIVPYQHTADLPGLATDCASELFELARRSTAILAAELSPAGFNLGMNLGRTAGAAIDQHLHLHIVPRWSGDANFMAVVGGTKLVPESLEATYARLRPHFEQLI